jgi:hypothetical protein
MCYGNWGFRACILKESESGVAVTEVPRFSCNPAAGSRELSYLKAWMAARNPAGADQGGDGQSDLERLFLHILNKSKDGISIHAPDFTIVGVNTTMHEWYATGRTLVGRKCFEAYHGRDRPCDHCPFDLALRTGRPQIGVVPYQVGGRPRGDQELSVFPLLDERRQVLCGLEYVRDITRLEPEVRTLERLRRHVQLQKRTQHELESALAVLLRRGPRLERRIADEMAENLDTLVMPLVAKLRARCAGTELASEMALLEEQIREVAFRDSGPIARALRVLTAREREVAALVRQGRTSKEISAVLGISAKAVDFHRTSIRRKLGKGRAAGTLQALLGELEHPRASPE